jgi:hypothetical protein
VTKDYLRYEDVAQDGRMMPIALPAALGGLWREVLTDHPGAKNALAKGIVPILTRLTLVTSGQRIRVDQPVETRSGFDLAHDAVRDQVTRLFLNIWTEVHGAAGSVVRGGPPGAPVLAGSVFAEHTFTRPLAPPGQRGVTRLDVEGYPALPMHRYSAKAAETAGEPPPGARWIDELTWDRPDHIFTLDQTDSNQHVNSLVYIRIFQDAVNRRIDHRRDRLQLRTQDIHALRTQAVDIAYRKPCFVGDRVRTQVRLFDHAGTLGATGHILGHDGKPRCYVRVLVGP